MLTKSENAALAAARASGRVAWRRPFWLRRVD